jgi:acetolactate synthase-1/2/3 large subunit
MNTADLFIKCLEEEEVEYIFGIPGEETLDLVNAISESKQIKFITTRHEQGAAFMADVYGRLTGKAGVCLATLGPGATNLVTGVADANLDGAPLVAITGQVGTDKMHITSHQYLDLTKMFEPITKRTKQIVRPDTVSEIVRIAFKYSENLKPGATHIDLPTNIAKMQVEGVPLKKKKAFAGFATFDAIEKAARIISEAKNPVVIVGADAVHADVSEALTEFANRLRVPVVNTMMAKGMISFENKYSLWTMGIPQRDYINQLFDRADLVITIGYDIVELNPSKWNRNNNLDIIHIGYEMSHVNKFYQPKVEVVGDMKDSLYQIIRRSSRNSVPEFALSLRNKIKTEHDSYVDDLSFPMKPQRIINDIQKVLGEDDILISDVGAHKMWIARHYNCQKPNTCIISNGFASMGIAIPGAVAAKLVNPDKKVLAVTGDGGFMMNSQELETAYRIGTPFVTLIMNDGSYGLIKWKQMEQFNKSAYVDFTNPDFMLYAEAMHCKGYRVDKAEDLVPALIDAFKQNVPAIIDCQVDYSENLKLTERLCAIDNLDSLECSLQDSDG